MTNSFLLHLFGKMMCLRRIILTSLVLTSRGSTGNPCHNRKMISAWQKGCTDLRHPSVAADLADPSFFQFYPQEVAYLGEVETSWNDINIICFSWPAPLVAISAPKTVNWCKLWRFSWVGRLYSKNTHCHVFFFLRISTPLLLGEGRRNHVWWAHAKNSSICKLFSYWQLMSIPGFETREFVWFDVPLRRISVQTAHFGQSRWLLFPVVSLFVSGKEKTSETSSKMQGILHSENQEVELFRGFWNDFRRWLSSSYWELFECPIESPANHWVVWEYNIYFPKKKPRSFCVSVESAEKSTGRFTTSWVQISMCKRILVLMFVSASHHFES